MDFLPLEEHDDILPAQILHTLSLLQIAFVSWPSFFGILHFEQFHGDSQKRCLINQLLALFMSFTLIDISLQSFFYWIRTLFGPLGSILASFTTVCGKFCQICVTTTLSVCMTLKILQHLKIRKAQFLLTRSIMAKFFILLVPLLGLVMMVLMSYFDQNGAEKYLDGLLPIIILPAEESKPSGIQGKKPFFIIFLLQPITQLELEFRAVEIPMLCNRFLGPCLLTIK